MPLLDMPLDQLEKYQGCNPKPEDFDKYWDDTIAEMKSLSCNLNLKTADFPARNAKCFDMTFTGLNGARIYAKLLMPAKLEKPAPALVEFHGYTCSSGDWHSKLAWVNAGFVLASLDCRGQAGKSEDNLQVYGNTHSGHIIRGLSDSDPKKLYYRYAFADTAQLAGLIMGLEEVDAAKVGAMGGSQGGALTLACAALEPRIRKAAPCYPFLCDYQRVWEMDLAKGAYAEIKDYFKRFDPQHKNEKATWEKLGYIDVQHLAPRIKAEVLMAVGLMDDICPPSTQFAAYNKIKSKKRFSLFPDFGHEGLPEFGDQTYCFMQELFQS